MPSEKPDSYQCGAFEIASNPNVTQFVEKLNRMREAVDSCRIQPGVGYDIIRTTGGTVLSIKNANNRAGADIYPFKIETRQKDKKYQFFVHLGYVGSNSVKAKNQEKWVDFIPPARIYLEATIDDLTVTALEFKTNKHDETLEPVAIAEKQTASRIAIGMFFDPEDKKNYQLTQNVRTNLFLKLICADGYPALFMLQELAQ